MFLCCQSEQTIEQTLDWLVIRDVMMLLWCRCNVELSFYCLPSWSKHYNDVIMGTIASQITSLTIVYSILYSDADPRKHQSSASLAFVRGIHRGPVNSPRKWPVTRKMFSFHDVIMLGLVSLCAGVVYVCCTGCRDVCWLRADSRLAPSQWETLLQSNAVSHWLGTNLDSDLWLRWQPNSCSIIIRRPTDHFTDIVGASSPHVKIHFVISSWLKLWPDHNAAWLL